MYVSFLQNSETCFTVSTNLYSAAIDHFMHFNLPDNPKYYFISLLFCCPHNCPFYEIGVNKYEVKHNHYNPMKFHKNPTRKI